VVDEAMPTHQRQQSPTWRRVTLVAAILLVLGITLLPALTFASSHSGAGKAPTATVGASTQSNSLRLAMPDASPTVDPALVADEENVQLADLLYTGLVRLDAHYQVQPAAAQKIDISSDHRHYTFHIRHGLRFSNGDPITASDFQFSITRSLSPAMKSPSAAYYLLDIVGAAAVLQGKAKTVSGIQVTDPYTLKITTRWPVTYFLMELTYPTSFALDENRITKLGPAVNTNWYGKPVTSGPFRLKSIVPNNRIVLVPNKYYSTGKSAIHQVTISLTPLPGTDVYTYVTHNLDIVSLPSYVPKLAQQVGVHTTDALAIDGLYMDLKTKPFTDLRVRKALAMALPRKQVTLGALGSTITPFFGYVPSNEAGYDSSIKGPSYNPTAARALLKNAGYDSSHPFPKLTLSYVQDSALVQLVTKIAQTWSKNLGIPVSTRALTPTAMFTEVQSGSLPLYLYGWSADYPDPHDWLSLLWKSNAVNNNVHFHDTSFDKLVSAADVTWRPKRRMQLYFQAQKILAENDAWLPLYIPHRVAYIRPGVLNVSVTGYGIIPQSGTWSRVQVHGAASSTRGQK
jgi:oligopeptide transport system substrate-binding protein